MRGSRRVPGVGHAAACIRTDQRARLSAGAVALYDDLHAGAQRDPAGIELLRWARNLAPCTSAETFVAEATWVVLCSGVSYRAARSMERALQETGTCRHPLKAQAIAAWRAHHARWWAQYQAAPDDAARLAFLRTLPFMGGQALVYQLAKNLGLTGFCKPDRHLIRMAAEYGSDPQPFCEAIAAMRRVTVAYVDTVLWFGAARGWWKPGVAV